MLFFVFYQMFVSVCDLRLFLETPNLEMRVNPSQSNWFHPDMSTSKCILLYLVIWIKKCIRAILWIL